MMPMTTSCSDPVAPVLPVHRPRPALPLLAASTAIGSLGLAAGGTAAALLAVETTGRDAAAGLPLGALAAGQAGASLLVARLTARAGRGAGLVAGYAIGVLGALAVVAAAVLASFPLMLAGSLLLGGANAAIFLSRYAAADIGGAQARGPAAGAVLFAAPARTGARPALVVLGGTNLVMVAIMAVAPVQLLHHGHDLGFVGLAVSLHVAAMFAPSPVTGWLADRVGAAPVAAAGAVLLILAGIGGLDGHLGGPHIGGLLVVLGLGWNCGVVGGSALLAASVPPALRPRSEAIGEASMGLAAAAGAPAAGLVVALGGFTTTWVAGAVVGAVILTGTRRRP